MAASAKHVPAYQDMRLRRTQQSRNNVLEHLYSLSKQTFAS
jgi:hypothetical protein